VTNELPVQAAYYRDRLKEMKSLWYVVGLVQDSGVLYYEVPTIPAIASNPDDEFHIIKPNEVARLDKLAYKYYLDDTLWWVIAVANAIFFPMDETPVGTVLRIPSKRVVYAEIIR